MGSGKSVSIRLIVTCNGCADVSISGILEERPHNVKRYLFRGELSLLSARIKLVVMAALLCLALGATIFCAVQTVQAIQRFRQDEALAMAGDVRTIRPWMTIPYISRVYHVPESYLYNWLNISNPPAMHRISLRSLAIRYRRPLDNLISDVQNAIKTYRKEHPPQHSFVNRYPVELPTPERRKT